MIYIYVLRGTEQQLRANLVVTMLSNIQLTVLLLPLSWFMMLNNVANAIGLTQAQPETRDQSMR